MHKEKHQKVGKMGKHLWLVSILMMVFLVSDAVAAGVLVPASQFPNFANGEYMQPNMIYQNSALAVNMDGVYEGEVWAKAVYTDGAVCSPGTYLPANKVVCETCLEDNYCLGGTFLLSAENQGITSCVDGLSSPAGASSADMCDLLHITCDAGTYLPAGATSARDCAICPENKYCGDDNPREFVANAVEDQGVASCPSGLVSPRGTTSVGGCGKIMHIGEDVLYLTSEQQTTPALAVKLEGKVYYAKMTPGAKAINEATNTSLRTRVDGVEYSIQDNVKLYNNK